MSSSSEPLPRASRPSILGWMGFAWGLGGVITLLASATVRLTEPALLTFEHELGPLHWLAAVLSVVFMAYSEGYRGFYKAFSPRVVGRARSLVDEPTAVRLVLAPAFCMGFFGATRRRMVGVWVLTAMIILLVIGVRMIPQPWRGIVDLGVVVGLALGVASLIWFGARVVFGVPLEVRLDLPRSAS